MNRRQRVAMVGTGLLLCSFGSQAVAQNHASPTHEPPAAQIGSSHPPLPEIPKQPDPVLCAPAGAGDMKRVQALLRGGADVNAPDTLGRTPLMMALAKYFPPPGAPAETGSVATETQRQARKLKIARLLIKRGADIARRSTIGMTALHYAVMWPDTEAALQMSRELLAGGAPVDARMGTGLTPLRMAVDRGRVAIARVLVEGGANPGMADDDGKTPLARAEAVRLRDLVAALTTPVAPSSPSPAPSSPAAPPKPAAAKRAPNGNSE
jgi:ankyrin repeat protein